MAQNAIISPDDPALRLALVKLVENFRELLKDEVDELMFEYDEDTEEYPVQKQMLARFSEFLSSGKPLTQRSAAAFFHVTVLAPDWLAVRDDVEVR